MSIRFFAVTWGMIVLAAIMDAFGAFVVKMRIDEIGPINFESLRIVIDYFFSLIRSPLALTGGVCILISPIPYAIALSRMEVSVVYPVSVALNFLILIPMTIFFLGESFSLSKAVGIFLIVVSLYLLYK